MAIGRGMQLLDFQLKETTKERHVKNVQVTNTEDLKDLLRELKEATNSVTRVVKKLDQWRGLLEYEVVKEGGKDEIKR